MVALRLVISVIRVAIKKNKVKGNQKKNETKNEGSEKKV